MPGVGMCPPSRYTSRIMAVNRIRRFSSGILNMLW